MTSAPVKRNRTMFELDDDMRILNDAKRAKVYALLDTLIGEMHTEATKEHAEKLKRALDEGHDVFARFVYDWVRITSIDLDANVVTGFVTSGGFKKRTRFQEKEKLMINGKWTNITFDYTQKEKDDGFEDGDMPGALVRQIGQGTMMIDKDGEYVAISRDHCIKKAAFSIMKFNRPVTKKCDELCSRGVANRTQRCEYHIVSKEQTPEKPQQ